MSIPKILYRSSHTKMSFDTSPSNSVKNKGNRINKCNSIVNLNNDSHYFKKFSLTEKLIKSYKDHSRIFAIGKANHSVENQQKAIELNELLNSRLQELELGSSKWINEKEIIESIFDEIGKYFIDFENLLNILKLKLLNNAVKRAKEHYSKKIEKMVKENSILISKLNNLTRINAELECDNKQLKEDNSNFKILFGENPDFIVNYKNIVDKMLHQCETISNLKRENQKLRKTEMLEMLRLTDMQSSERKSPDFENS